MSQPLTRQTATDIVNALRAGAVPAEGLEHIAVGLDDYLNVVRAELRHVASGRGGFKAIRGEWGSGKTFLARRIVADALEQGFAASYVTLSSQETRLHKPEEVYRAIVQGLALPGVRRGALAQVVERWVAQHVRAATETDGVGPDAPGHDKAVARRIERALGDVAAEAPSFAMALGAYYTNKREEEFALARGLLGVLAGDPNVGAPVKKAAGLKGKLDGTMAYAYLKALLRVIYGAGFSGLCVVLDEADRVVAYRGPERRAAYEELRRMLDAVSANDFAGLYLILTGTRALFEGKQGISEYGALEQRLGVRFSDDEPDDLKQRQVRLRGFDRERLILVAKRVREIFPADHGDRVLARADDTLAEAMATKVTEGFGGTVSVAPRTFLREWVRVLDLVDQHADYDPKAQYKFDLSKATDLSPEEKVAAGLAAAIDNVPAQEF